MIFIISVGSLLSSDLSTSHTASIAGPSGGSKGCSKSLVKSRIVLYTSSKAADMILTQ